MEGARPKLTDSQKKDENRKRKRHRPRTKGYRLFLKNEIEKALCAQPSTVNHLFSNDESGFCSADLNELVTFLGLNSENYNRLSRSALKTMSNISSIFRIDGSPSERLRIFKKSSSVEQDSSIVYVDNLPFSCRVLYILQRASMFGTVVSVRPKFFGEKEQKLCYTFSSGNGPVSSTTDPLLSHRRVESAFIQFVCPTSAEKFCKAYKHNAPGKFASPGKRKKSFISKRRRAVHRAIAHQKNALLSKGTLINEEEVSCDVKDVSANVNFGCKNELLSSENYKRTDEFSEANAQTPRTRKRPADSPPLAVKRDHFEEMTKNPQSVTIIKSTVCSEYEPGTSSEIDYVLPSICSSTNVTEHVDRFSSPDDDAKLYHSEQCSRTHFEKAQQYEKSVLTSSSDDDKKLRLQSYSQSPLKKKRQRRKKHGKRKKLIFKKRTKVSHVTRYFSRMQVLPLSAFIKLRSDYLKLRKASMAKLKKWLKENQVPLRAFNGGNVKYRKVRGRNRLLARAAALRNRYDEALT